MPASCRLPTMPIDDVMIPDDEYESESAEGQFEEDFEVRRADLGHSVSARTQSLAAVLGYVLRQEFDLRWQPQGAGESPPVRLAFAGDAVHLSARMRPQAGDSRPGSRFRATLANQSSDAAPADTLRVVEIDAYDLVSAMRRGQAEDGGVVEGDVQFSIAYHLRPVRNPRTGQIVEREQPFLVVSATGQEDTLIPVRRERTAPLRNAASLWPAPITGDGPVVDDEALLELGLSTDALLLEPGEGRLIGANDDSVRVSRFSPVAQPDLLTATEHAHMATSESVVLSPRAAVALSFLQKIGREGVAKPARQANDLWRFQARVGALAGAISLDSETQGPSIWDDRVAGRIAELVGSVRLDRALARLRGKKRPSPAAVSRAESAAAYLTKGMSPLEARRLREALDAWTGATGTDLSARASALVPALEARLRDRPLAEIEAVFLAATDTELEAAIHELAPAVGRQVIMGGAREHVAALPVGVEFDEKELTPWMVAGGAYVRTQSRDVNQLMDESLAIAENSPRAAEWGSIVSRILRQVGCDDALDAINRTLAKEIDPDRKSYDFREKVEDVLGSGYVSRPAAAAIRIAPKLFEARIARLCELEAGRIEKLPNGAIRSVMGSADTGFAVEFRDRADKPVVRDMVRDLMRRGLYPDRASFRADVNHRDVDWAITVPAERLTLIANSIAGLGTNDEGRVPTALALRWTRYERGPREALFARQPTQPEVVDSALTTDGKPIGDGTTLERERAAVEAEMEELRQNWSDLMRAELTEEASAERTAELAAIAEAFTAGRRRLEALHENGSFRITAFAPHGEWQADLPVLGLPKCPEGAVETLISKRGFQMLLGFPASGPSRMTLYHRNDATLLASSGDRMTLIPTLDEQPVPAPFARAVEAWRESTKLDRVEVEPLETLEETRERMDSESRRSAAALQAEEENRRMISARAARARQLEAARRSAEEVMRRILAQEAAAGEAAEAEASANLFDPDGDEVVTQAMHETLARGRRLYVQQDLFDMPAVVKERFSDEKKKEIIREASATSHRAVAEKYGIDVSTLTVWRRKFPEESAKALEANGRKVSKANQRALERVDRQRRDQGATPARPKTPESPNGSLF